MSKCKVCLVLNNTTYSLETKKYIDVLIKNGSTYDIINKELCLKNSDSITQYYINKHRANCLRDFAVPLSDTVNTSNNLTSQVDKNNIFAINSKPDLNILIELEKYRNMNFQEKEDNDIQRLKEIKFMSSIIIHHQLMYGRNSHKATIPKEDISALKQVEDILQILTSDNFDKDEIPEFNINILDVISKNKELLTKYDFNHNDVTVEKTMNFKNDVRLVKDKK